MEEKITSVIDLIATLISQVESGTSHVIIRKKSSVEDKDKPLQKIPQMLYAMLILLAGMAKQNIRSINMKFGSTRVRIVNASKDDEKAYKLITSYLDEWYNSEPGTSLIRVSSNNDDCQFEESEFNLN